jgi:hypothetical protein
MLELMENPSARVAFESSRHVLAVGGIAPTEHRHITADVQVAGWVVDLTPQRLEPEPVDVTPSSSTALEQQVEADANRERIARLRRPPD